MRSKPLSERDKLLKARIEKALGMPVFSWESGTLAITFRVDEETPLTIKHITDLSIELGTDRINFNCGHPGSRRYSELTPGSPASSGFITVFLEGIKEKDNADHS